MIEIQAIKTALRISHNKLDDEISNTIDVARMELIRAGIHPDKVDIIISDDKLIDEAIKTYCLFSYSNNEKMAEGYFNSWQYQVENLRKSSGYRVGDDNV